MSAERAEHHRVGRNGDSGEPDERMPQRPTWMYGSRARVEGDKRRAMGMMNENALADGGGNGKATKASQPASQPVSQPVLRGPVCLASLPAPDAAHRPID